MGKANKSVEEINKEWLKLRPEIIKAKGDMCIYCGAKATEYHHIVPRHMGGDNRLSNIVPLCYECHKKAHSKRSCESHENLGRKPLKVPDNFDEVADAYLNNRIGRIEALEATGLKKSAFYRMLEGRRKRKYNKNGSLDEVINAYLSNQVTHSEALEMTGLVGQMFNKRLREYRERTGDMRIPRG